MKLLALFIAAIILTACSTQEMIEKTAPENVRANHTAHINKLLERDTSLMESAFNLDMENEDTQKQIAVILENIPDGKEIRRDYVGFNSSSGLSTGEGKTRDISLTSEIQTEGGFMTVYSEYALDSNGECCALTNINVAKYETSPIRLGLEAAAKIGKIVGLVFLGLVIFLIGLVVFLVSRKRRRKKAAAMGG